MRKYDYSKKCKQCGKELTYRQKSMKQKYCSLECRGKAQSLYQSGENNPMYGKKMSECTKEKLSRSVSKSKTGTKRPPFTEEWKTNIGKAQIGRKRTKETKEKISKALKKNNWMKKDNYSNEKHPMYGKKHSEETREKIRNNREDTSGTNNPMYGHKHTEESKQKISQKVAQHVQLNRKNGIWNPKVNPISVEYFKTFDSNNDTNGYYGNDEYLIEELGYFPDYINFKEKLIIEWDEKDHKKPSKTKKDKIRQNRIEEFYNNGFYFIRIDEEKVSDYNDFITIINGEINGKSFI
jgi:hypothetical protein